MPGPSVVTRHFFLHAPLLSEWVFSPGTDIHALVTFLIAVTKCPTETTFETLTQKKQVRVNNMAQQAKEIAAKLNGQGSIPMTSVEEGEDQLLQVVLGPQHMHCTMRTPLHMRTYKHTDTLPTDHLKYSFHLNDCLSVKVLPYPLRAPFLTSYICG